MVVPGAGEGRTVMVGVNNVTLRCMLDSGGDAPDVMWRCVLSIFICQNMLYNCI